MVKKQQLVGGLTSLFSSKDAGVLPCPSTSSSMLSASSSSSSAWQWPSCGHPRTLSFRQEQQQKQVHGHNSHQTTMYKTMNSAYSVDSSFSTGDSSTSSCCFSEEAVIRALHSDRLFFEPDSSGIIKSKSKKQTDDATTVAFGGATAMSVESQNPYRDFRESMEAMVMSHGGVKDWRWLEEMLGWYLRANGKSTHGLIVGAFVDLLVSLSNTPPSSSSSPATPTTSCPCSCSCSCSL